MSRIARTLPVSAKMYRNFAVITVVATVFIAIFADDQGRARVEEELAAQASRKPELGGKAGKTVDQTKGGLRIRENGAQSGSFGSESGGDGGVVNVYAGGATGEARRQRPRIVQRARRLPDGRVIVPMGPDEVGRPVPLPPGLEDVEQARPDLRPSPAQYEAMISASRARSGSD